MPVNVTTWLRGLGLEQYATAFVENEVDELSLPSLTAEDLRELGVTAIGHRRRLLDAIAALRAANIMPPPAKRQPPDLLTGAAESRLGERGVASRIEELPSGDTPLRNPPPQGVEDLPTLLSPPPSHWVEDPRTLALRPPQESKPWFRKLLIPVGFILPLSLLFSLWPVFSKIETPTQNDRTTKTAENASAPAQNSTTNTQSVQGDQDRPLSTIILETRMARVFDRDQAYVDKHLDGHFPGGKGNNADVNGTAAHVPPSKQGPVNDKLTAEEVFASTYNAHNFYTLGPLFNPELLQDCKNCLAPAALSESESLRYRGLIRIYQMAAITLFNNRCITRRLTGDQAEALATIEDQFKKLPKIVQRKALDRQTKIIESRSDFYDHNGKLIHPGGFSWFCIKMTDDIVLGKADPMLKTAREGFFPIEGD